MTEFRLKVLFLLCNFIRLGINDNYSARRVLPMKSGLGFLLLSMPVLSFSGMSAASDLIPLSAAELNSTVGGAAISVVEPRAGARIDRDNIFIKASVFTVGDRREQIQIQTQLGDGKTWYTPLAMKESGSRSRRGEYVASQYFDLASPPISLYFKRCLSGVNSELCEAGELMGNKEVRDVDIDPAVKVVGVWFHNMLDGDNAASVSSKILADSVDWIADGNLSDIMVDGEEPEAADNIDRVYRGCGIQFRLRNVDTVDATEWLPLNTDWTHVETLNPEVPEGSTNKFDYKDYMPKNYRDHVANIDPTGDYMHVFIVNSINGGSGGFANSYADNLIAVTDDFISGYEFTEAARLIAHEIGHTQGLLHISQDDWGDKCARSETDNLMCPGGITDVPGRRLDAEQCAEMAKTLSTVKNLNR